MAKVVGVLKKPAAMSRDDFITWWLDVHAPLARRAPGMRRYVVSPAIANPKREPAFDGIAELWFDDAESARRAMNSPELAAAGEDLVTHSVQASLFITEEHVVVRGES